MAIKLKSFFTACVAGASLSATEPCFAATIVDPPGDILSSYVGQVGPDLDILQFTVTSDASNFYLFVLLSGAPGTTALSRYNVGVDRGTGTDTFPAGFRSGVSQDAVVNLIPGTMAAEVRLFAGINVVTVTPLPSGLFTTSGNTMSVTVPISLLPSTGFASTSYTFLLWSRTQIAGVPSQLGVADFAPDTGNLSLVPEPSTWTMMLMGFAGVGLAIRRQRQRVSSAA